MKALKYIFATYNSVFFRINKNFIYLFFMLLLYPLFSAQGNDIHINSESYILIINDTVNIPKKVKPERNGNLRLKASVGRAIGPDIKFMPEWKAFGWFTAKDHVEWEVKVTKKGEYDVYLEWSVSDKEAGKPFVFETKDKDLRGRVSKTGSWETFKTEKIGRIHLTRGLQKMKFKPDSEFEKGALLDLREIKLVPVK